MRLAAKLIIPIVVAFAVASLVDGATTVSGQSTTATPCPTVTGTATGTVTATTTATGTATGTSTATATGTATGTATATATATTTGTATATATACPSVTGTATGTTTATATGTATGTTTATATATNTGTAGTGNFIGTGIYPTGFSLVVWGGGTVGQLVLASGCTAPTLTFWVTQNGVFITYVPGTGVAEVNAAWNAKFPGGNIPANTGILGRCVS